MPYWRNRVLRLPPNPIPYSGGLPNSGQEWVGDSLLSPRDSRYLIPHPSPPPRLINLAFSTPKPLPEAVDGGQGRAAGQTTFAETPGRGGSGGLRWEQGTRWRSRISEDPDEASQASAGSTVTPELAKQRSSPGGQARAKIQACQCWPTPHPSRPPLLPVPHPRPKWSREA